MSKGPGAVMVAILEVLQDKGGFATTDFLKVQVPAYAGKEVAENSFYRAILSLEKRGLIDFRRKVGGRSRWIGGGVFFIGKL